MDSSSDPHHRKIDLQSPQDLAYLHSNIKHVAQQKLDLHIPPSAAPLQGEDDFRMKVEGMVQSYITQTLTLALPSLSINGLPATPSNLSPSPSSTSNLPPPSTTAPSSNPSALDTDPNYETYDPALASRLRALYATLEAETIRVASLRREAPGKAAALYAARLKDEMSAEEVAFEGGRNMIIEREVVGGAGLKGLERGVEAKGRWEVGVRGLERLKGVTEVLAKGERAREVVGVVEGM